LGIVGTLQFRAKLERVVQQLGAGRDTMENISIDDNLFEVLALLNLLQKQKFYCRKVKGWVNIFDTGCYGWQPKLHSL